MRFHPHQPDPQQGEILATFGEANLIKTLERRFELVGGSAADRAAAEVWISLFMKNEVVHRIATKPQPNHP